MTSIVSAITGSGSKNAASAQATAYANAQGISAETLQQQLALGYEALRTQQEMYNNSLELSDPYRRAGESALAKYESLIYGIPISETSAYQAASTPSANKTQVSYVDPSFNESFRSMYASTNPQYAGKSLFYDSASGQVGLSGDIDLGVTIQPNEDGLQSAMSTARAKIQAAGETSAPDAGDVDLSHFGDASQVFSFEETPGYQYRLDESQAALEQSAAARSGVLSGSAIKAATQNAQDYATSEYDNVLARLGGLIDTGANMTGQATSQSIQSGTDQAGVLSNIAGYYGQNGENQANLETMIGAAKASGYLGQQAAGTNVLNLGAQLAGNFF